VIRIVQALYMKTGEFHAGVDSHTTPLDRLHIELVRIVLEAGKLNEQLQVSVSIHWWQ
jgi:hypothetical protein